MFSYKPGDLFPKKCSTFGGNICIPRGWGIAVKREKNRNALDCIFRRAGGDPDIERDPKPGNQIY